MTREWVCWKCGASLAAMAMPLARRDECPACRADLHVCRMCRFFDARLSRSCAEPVAEEVLDKARANFCGYFEARPGAFASSAATDQARATLDALFGGAEPSQPAAEDARRKLDELFGRTGPEE